MSKKMDPLTNRRLKQLAQAKKRYGTEWKQLGVKAAIVDIFNKAVFEKKFGPNFERIISVQEVAQLLEVPLAVAWPAVRELFAEEKLEYYGYSLYEYQHRFRLPEELRSLIRYLIEYPIGWPNGEAGDCFLLDIEKAIEEKTTYKHGKEAFPLDYPYINPLNLFQCGYQWISMALASVIGDPKVAEHFCRYTDLEQTAKFFEKFAQTCRQLAQNKK